MQAMSARGDSRKLQGFLANQRRPPLGGECNGGSYHAERQPKYARRYLAEADYRFNHSFDLDHMLPQLATTLMRCKPCPEQVCAWRATSMAEQRG
jgi:hypothetical protein